MTYDFFNIKVDEKKEFKTALAQIYGCNVAKLNQLYKILGINKNKVWKIQNFNNQQLAKIKQYLPELGYFDSDLKKNLSIEYDKFFELKCYKRNRFLLGLPCRGQRTKSNAQTSRKIRINKK